MKHTASPRYHRPSSDRIPRSPMLACFLGSLLLCSLFFANAIPAQVRNENDPLAAALNEQLSCLQLDLFTMDGQRPTIENRDFCLSSVYREMGPHPLWVDMTGPGETAAVIIDRLRRSYREGLDPEDYEVPLIETYWSSRQPEDLARLDTLLTYNLIKYIHDVSFGQLKLHRADPKLFAEAGNTGFDPAQAIRIVRTIPDLGAYLDTLPPQHHYYVRLKKALEQYRLLALTAQWPLIPAGPLIRPGDVDQRLQAVLTRLAATETLDDPETWDTDNYHDRLVAAVRAFQQTHGLEPDGIIGPQTLAMLNQTPAELAAVIRANLARWRWQDHHISDTYLMVNIAAFRVKAVSNGILVHDLPVIVGKFQHQTPVFSDSIVYLDFNPFWNVTPGIARNEDLPALRQNPHHLVERNIRLFSSWQPDARELDSTAIDWHNVTRSQMSRYLLRQDPGPWNALGQVKFVFPNHHAVYLHDTPSRDLFLHSSRSFSHGCIRVSQPLVLALFCLQQNNEGWTMEAIENIVASGQRKVVTLQERLPIHITYQTAWVDNDDIIHFNADIYQRDTKLLQVLTTRLNR
jgi:L,D-transpeptidase YcbB